MAHRLFERDTQKLFFAGEIKPVIDLDEHRGMSCTDLEISPDGQWAAYYSRSNAHYVETHGDFQYLVDGKLKKEYRLIEGWVCDLKWFPAAR